MNASNRRTNTAPIIHFNMRFKTLMGLLCLWLIALMLFHGYYHFSSSVALFQILKSVSHLTQGLVSPVDNRRDFSRLHEIGEIGQIVVIQLCDKKHEFLFDELRA